MAVIFVRECTYTDTQMSFWWVLLLLLFSVVVVVSFAAPEVVEMMTFDAANNERVVKVTIFTFKCVTIGGQAFSL